MKPVWYYTLGIFFFPFITPFGAFEIAATGFVYLSHSQFHIVKDNSLVSVDFFVFGK